MPKTVSLREFRKGMGKFTYSETKSTGGVLK